MDRRQRSRRKPVGIGRIFGIAIMMFFAAIFLMYIAVGTPKWVIFFCNFPIASNFNRFFRIFLCLGLFYTSAEILICPESAVEIVVFLGELCTVFRSLLPLLFVLYTFYPILSHFFSIILYVKIRFLAFCTKCDIRQLNNWIVCFPERISDGSFLCYISLKS